MGKYRSRMAAVLLATLGWQGAPAAADPLSPAVQLKAFETAQAIEIWPRLRGCGYEQAWGSRLAGTVLEVRTYLENGVRQASGTSALREGATCHVMPRHSLDDWPADLPSGLYVIAARALPADQASFKPWRLQVVGVLREPGPGSGLARSLAAELDKQKQ